MLNTLLSGESDAKRKDEHLVLDINSPHESTATFKGHVLDEIARDFCKAGSNQYVRVFGF